MKSRLHNHPELHRIAAPTSPHTLRAVYGIARATTLLFALASASFWLASCSEYSGPPVALSDSLSGGTQTTFVFGDNAYSQVLPNTTADHLALHERGDQLFEATYVAAPSEINPGLGPIYNADACRACHVNDGRGRPPVSSTDVSGLLLRLSARGTNPHGAPLPVPGFGGQLQERSIVTTVPEASFTVSYTTQRHTFKDGSVYELAVPTYDIRSPYARFPSGTMISPRVAPPVFGLGLLESISEATILDQVARQQQLGLRGKVNRVWDEEAQQLRIGRFGWKCDQPSIRQQSAAALNQDMGLTNVIFPIESSFGQMQYRAVTDTGKRLEVSADELTAYAGYSQTLGVPARRNVLRTDVLRGEYLFRLTGCASCHLPSVRTGYNPTFPELSDQTIAPSTDMLLHDMGPDLSDGRPVFLAGGSDWRTAPLWGIGLTEIVSGHTRFLHDGRARSLMEAIMWHGGEALHAREAVRELSRQDRDALIAFLRSL